MTKHDKKIRAADAGVDLSRRHFLIGSAASGLVLTYAATSSFTIVIMASITAFTFLGF